MNTDSYVRKLRGHPGHEPLLVPGVDAIIQKSQDDVLLHERTDLGLWGLPGGTLELGESVLHALRREVKEETGIDVVAAKLVGLYTGPRDTITYPNGDVLENFSAVFQIVKWSGEASVASKESRRVEFFPLDRLPNMVNWHREVLEDFARWDGQVVVK